MASENDNTMDKFTFRREWFDIINSFEDVDVRREALEMISYRAFFGELPDLAYSPTAKAIFRIIEPKLVEEMKRIGEISAKRREIGRRGGLAIAKQIVSKSEANGSKTEANQKQNEAKGKQMEAIGKQLVGENTAGISQRQKEDDEFVERMYQMYPSKCPVRGTSLGKCSKDKERIRKLLKTYSKEDIEKVFKMEIGNKYGKTYMQNFSTFLNNFPDPKEISEDTAPLQPQKPQQPQTVHRDPNSAEELDEYYKILKQRNIENEEAYERSLAEQRKSEILRYIEERKDDVCILGVGETFQNDYFDLTGLEDGTIKWVCRVANCQRRFYFNRQDDVMVSIPLDAPPMPDKMSVYDFESKGWR
jgi:hypothetical protein